MVWGTIFLLIMSSLYMVMVAALRQFQQGTAYVEAQQEALKGMRRLVADLSNSVAADVTLGTEHLWFLSPERLEPASGYDYDPIQKRLRWWKWVAYFRGGDELVRSELPLAGAPVIVVTPPPHPLPTLAMFAAVPFPARTVVARHLERLTVEGQDGSYELTLVCGVAVDSQRSTRVTLSSQVTVRNR